MSIFGSIAGFGLNRHFETPVVAKSRWRKFFLALCKLTLRSVMFFSFGIYYIKTKGVQASSKFAPVRLIVPHSHWLDVAAFFVALPLSDTCSFVMKAETPFAKFPIHAFMAIVVERSKAAKKSYVKEQIQKRCIEATSEKGDRKDWFPIIISPEGTALNGTALHKFKLGPFNPGKPVQPVWINFGVDNNKPGYKQAMSMCDHVGNTYKGNFRNLLRHFLYFYQPLEVTYMDPICPDEDEIMAPILFAQNARQKISEESGLPIIDTTWEDSVIARIFKDKYNRLYPYGIPKFVKLQHYYGTNLTKLKLIFEKYMDLGGKNINQKGQINKKIFFQIFEGFSKKYLESGKFKSYFGDHETDLPELLDFSDALELLVYQCSCSGLSTRLSTVIEDLHVFDNNDGNSDPEDDTEDIVRQASVIEIGINRSWSVSGKSAKMSTSNWSRHGTSVIETIREDGSDTTVTHGIFIRDIDSRTDLTGDIK